MLRASGALEQLKESRAGLAHAQSLAHIGSWEWDLTSGEIRCSDEVYNICCLSGKGGNPILDPVHQLDRCFVQSSLDDAIARRAPLSFDYRILLDNAVERTLHAELVTVLDQDGNPVSLTGTIQDITERKHAEEQIRLLAYYDALTGLPNRRFFLQQLEQALLFANRNDRMLAVLFLDLDRFKLVNDTLGHGVGDRLLQDVADRLLRCLRRGDCLARADEEEGPPSLVSRLGGDEFTIMLSDIEHFQDVAKVARRILEAISQPYSFEGQEVFLSTSIGISLYPFDATTASDLIRNADGAMYQAKEQGRNGYQIYDESMNAKALERIILESQLHKALKEEEFTVYYQPQVSSRSGRIVGVEALVRWNSRELGIVEPGRFLALAEEIGLVIQIDKWMMRHACQQHRDWIDAGLPPVTLALNISGQHFLKNDLLETVTAVLAETGMDPGHLELELTEGVLMAHTEKTVQTLKALKEMGVRLAIDDFGTGFSSLSYLKRFPLDVLKIDRTFINDITSDPDDAAITLATIEMAHTLKLQVIAEGVETEAQLEFLKDHGCDTYQGYLFSRPVPPDSIASLLVPCAAIPCGG
jgi:diguanylate cyclase (GGDEF)-like protein